MPLTDHRRGSTLPTKPSRPSRWRSAAATSEQAATSAWVVLAALVLGLGWLFGEVRTRTGWDDTYYLLQVSSLVEDGDLDLRNDALYSALSPRDLQTFLTATLPSGTLKNTFSIGPTVLWLPAYAAGMPWRAATAAAAPVRWDRPQLAALHLLSLAFLAAVAWCVYRLLRAAGAERRLALLATAALLVGTPLAVYGPAVYTMAHLPSAVATSLLLASVTWLEREPRLDRALLAGVALGLVFLVRWQDAVFGLLLWVPLAPLLGQRREWPRLAKLLGAMATGAMALALLQLQAWHLEVGSWLTMPQGGEYMRWSHPHLGDFLFSGYAGLLSWSPVFALAAAGLLLPWRCRLSPRWRMVALLALAAQVYVNAAVRDWWGGDSFGARRMTSCVPLLAIGLANLAAVVSMRGRRRPLVLLLAALSLWGCFTANLYWRNVRDLSLVLRGAPSLAAREVPLDGNALTDPVQVRREAVRPAVARLHNYFAGMPGVRRSLGVGLTVALMGAVVIGAFLLFSRAPTRLLLPAVMLALLGTTLWCHLRLALGPRPDRQERAVWQRVAEPWSDPSRQLAPVATQAESEAALLDMRPEPVRRAAPTDAYRYLAMLAGWEAENPRRAIRLLASLTARDYPVAVALRRRIDALGPGAEVLRLLPGAFFEPRPGAPSRTIAVPWEDGDGRRGEGEWKLDFDLRPGALEPAAVYDLVTLQDGNRAELARVSLEGRGAVQLATPQTTVEAALSFDPRPACHLHIRNDPGRNALVVEVSTGDGQPTRLTSPRAAGSPRPARLLLGRNRQGHASFPLWFSTFSDLWMTNQDLRR
jgi:hypothetical protein